MIDWGGTGKPLVFLGGAGATAHAFDTFAPLLSDDFRVLGITRRGMGGSSDIPPDDFQDLLNDIEMVLDALDLGSVVLVGHSFAGFELTRFAERHGDRCSGLVFLDAAYDYAISDVGRIYRDTPPPETPPMLGGDSASVRSVQAWYERTQGFSPSESELRATGRFDPNGRYLGRTPMTETGRRVAGLRRPDVNLDALDCPSLGMFPLPGPLESWHPSYEAWDPEERRNAGRWQNAFLGWMEETRDNFGGHPQNQVVEFPNAGHMFFLERPEEVAEAIRAFVLGLN